MDNDEFLWSLAAGAIMALVGGIGVLAAIEMVERLL